MEIIGVIASGVSEFIRWSMGPDIGYVFTDNGRDWEGDDYPFEELNLLEIGSDYGWPNDEPETPIPNGTLGPIGTFDPHSSANSIALRHSNLPFLEIIILFSSQFLVHGTPLLQPVEKLLGLIWLKIKILLKDGEAKIQ